MSDTNVNGKTKSGLFATQSVVIVAIALGYIGLTWYSLWRWNAEVSAALVTGFVIFAQTTVRGFFDWLHALPLLSSSPDGTVTKTETLTKETATT